MYGLNAFIHDSLPAQRAEITFNDVHVFSEQIRGSSGRLEIEIPDMVNSNSFSGIVIKLRFSDAVSPLDLGISNDSRTLAFGLRAISFQ